MINKVLYLCINNSLPLGFVFPNELPPNYYSPGFFIIDFRSSETYTFSALNKGKLSTYNLYTKGNLGFVKTEYGLVFFRISKVNSWYNKYVGNYQSLSNFKNLHILQCTEENKLELLCKNENFYFIGYSLK